MPKTITEEEIKKLFKRCDITPGNRIRHSLDTSFNLRSEKDEEGNEKDYSTLTGKAVAYESDTVLYRFNDPWDNTDYEVHEVITHGAIDANTDMTDVVLDVNHDCVNGGVNIPIARTRNDSLELVELPDGYGFKAMIYHSNQRTMQVAEDVAEGLLSKCSFAFQVNDNDVVTTETVRSEDNVHVISRRINHIAMVADVSVVTNPAYSDTSVTLSRGEVTRLENLLNQKREAENSKLDEMRKRIMQKTSFLK